MTTLLLFGPARSAAGRSRLEIEATRVDELCELACVELGQDFRSVLEISAVWVNGEPVTPTRMLSPGDEVAVLPPVSGGA